MERKFRLIEGGLKDKTQWRRYFISAYVTDTRLMGVLGMYIHWRAADRGQTADFHQFFYFDAEETGFETYLGLWSDDPQEVAEKERENCGGLGGKKINLTLTEARHILRHYLEFNRAHDLPMPPGKEEYLDLLKDLVPLNTKHLLHLFSLIEITRQADQVQKRQKRQIAERPTFDRAPVAPQHTQRKCKNAAS